MILYTLRCADGHRFEAWLRDSAAFDAQRAAGLLACSVCGTTEVAKDLMAPAVGSRANRGDGRAEPDPRPLSTPSGPAELALRALREKVERDADYVGGQFAEEARRIHSGDGKGRPIWGEATVGEAKSLRDDGIPVAPLPWMRRRDA